MDAHCLSTTEMDLLGEVANITIGTCASALEKIIGTLVTVSTPKVTLVQKSDLERMFTNSYVFVGINYAEGLEGGNVLLITEQDAKMFADIAMHTNGKELKSELNTLNLSTVGEIMNQMVGTSVTELSNILQKRISITPPDISIIDISQLLLDGGALSYLSDSIVLVTVNLEANELLHTEIMQFYSIDTVHEICEMFWDSRLMKHA